MSNTRVLTVGPGSDDNKEFGKWMLFFRNQKKMTRTKSGASIGVTSEYIRLMENGKRTPALYTAIKLLEVYGISYYLNTRKSQLVVESMVFVFTSRIKNSRNESRIRVMNDDEIIEGIKALCAPLPECQKLRDRIIEALEVRFEELVK